MLRCSRIIPTPIRPKHIFKSTPNSSVIKSLPALEPFSWFFLPPPVWCLSLLAPTSPILFSRARFAVRGNSPSVRLWALVLAPCAAFCWQRVSFFAWLAPLSAYSVHDPSSPCLLVTPLPPPSPPRIYTLIPPC